jgi:hypothetical protein
VSSQLAYEPNELRLPVPIGKQPQWLQADTPRKVLRVGRRGSKTRFAMIAAIAGHGPATDIADQPLFPGILHGGDVLWVAVDYPQLTTVLWTEELVPRFGNLSWAHLNQQTHTLTLDGLGKLFLRGADALSGVRGMGKNLRGVIIDEAAHFDLEGALLNEVLPTLLDNRGWLIMMSTTNAGPDGNQAKRVPSFFNLICQGIKAGEARFKGWAEFYGTAFDNPKIDEAGINELISFYPPGSPQMKQEVYAELLKAGVGVALPKLSAERHLVERFPVPSHWTQFGGFDWGFNHPWVFGWYAVDEDGNVVKVETVWGREDLPEAIADKIIRTCPNATGRRFIIHSGHDIEQKKGEAIGFKGPTIAERLIARRLKTIKGNNARVLGLNNMRLYTNWEETWPKERRPRFTLMDTDGNRKCLTQMQAMQVDPDDLEDALKVDADAAGRGGDDSYDETRYALMSRPLNATPLPHEPGENESPGYNYPKGRPNERETGEEAWARMTGIPQSPTEGRYRVPMRRG